jgi:hypothetical protein
MDIFNMKSQIFTHNGSSTVNQSPKHFKWDFIGNTGIYDFYIDGDVHLGVKNKLDGNKKMLWTLESPFFNNGIFEYIKNNLSLVLDVFDIIFTYNEELLPLSEKFQFIPSMGSWIKEPKIHDKKKLISMITSNKPFTEQQKFRVDFANKHKDKIDVFGRGFNEILNKEDGLNDYMFSVCIENATMDTYFTEKILDCFATGTIPIYKGTKKILNYFDPEGIIFLDDIDIDDLTYDLYLSKIKSINNNFINATKFMLPEDIIYDIIKEKN